MQGSLHDDRRAIDPSSILLFSLIRCEEGGRGAERHVPCICHQQGGCCAVKGRVEQPSAVEVATRVKRDQLLVACLKPHTYTRAHAHTHTESIRDMHGREVQFRSNRPNTAAKNSNRVKTTLVSLLAQKEWIQKEGEGGRGAKFEGNRKWWSPK